MCRQGVRLGLVLLGALSSGVACRAKEPPINEPFLDNFERAEPGGTWNNTGADYRITDGRLTVKNAYNHPLWLRRKLPADAQIDVDVMSKSAAGDLKRGCCKRAGLGICGIIAAILNVRGPHPRDLNDAAFGLQRLGVNILEDVLQINRLVSGRHQQVLLRRESLQSLY